MKITTARDLMSSRRKAQEDVKKFLIENYYTCNKEGKDELNWYNLPHYYHIYSGFFSHIFQRPICKWAITDTYNAETEYEVEKTKPYPYCQVTVYVQHERNFDECYKLFEIIENSLKISVEIVKSYQK